MIYLIIILIAFFSSLRFEYPVQTGLRTTMPKIRLRQLCWYGLLLLCILVGGLRDYGIGGDTKYYVMTFRDIPALQDLEMNYLHDSRYQWLYNIFISGIKSISDDFTLLLLVHAAIVNMLVFWFFKKQAPYLAFMAVVFFVILNYVEFNTEIQRESLAVGMGLVAYYFFRRKSYLPAAAMWLVAFGFHISAIAILLYPIISRIGYSKRGTRIFAVICIASLFLFPAISSKMQTLTAVIMDQNADAGKLYDYYNSSEFAYHFNINYFVTLLFKCVILPLYGIKLLKGKCNRYIGFVYTYSLFILISSYSYGFYRFANYMAPFYAIFLAQMCYAVAGRFSKAKNWRTITMAIFVTLILYLFQSYQLGYAANGHRLYERYLPYKTIIHKYL